MHNHELSMTTMVPPHELPGDPVNDPRVAKFEILTETEKRSLIMQQTVDHFEEKVMCYRLPYFLARLLLFNPVGAQTKHTLKISACALNFQIRRGFPRNASKGEASCCLSFAIGIINDNYRTQVLLIR